MAFQSVPETCEIVIRATHASKEIVNVLHARYPGGYNTTNLQNLVDDVGAAIDGVYQPLANGNVIFSGVAVKGLEFVNDNEAFSADPTGAGSLGSDPLPANVSFCITLRSGLTGRSARGRIYMFPPGSDALSASPNLFTTGYATNCLTLWDTYAAAVTGAGWTPVIVSRFSGGAQRTVGVTFPITAFEARNNLTDSQRGRLAKGH